MRLPWGGESNQDWWRAGGVLFMVVGFKMCPSLEFHTPKPRIKFHTESTDVLLKAYVTNGNEKQSHVTFTKKKIFIFKRNRN
jgi:hypothetical protein